MTATGVQSSPPGAVPAPLADRPAVASLRLPWLRLAAAVALTTAALVLAAGIAAVTLLGARDSGRRSAPD
jgi:hypothetical protein